LERSTSEKIGSTSESMATPAAAKKTEPPTPRRIHAT
jgi:hypothetical protein